MRQPLSPVQLATVARKALDNAVALLDDGELLLRGGRAARASALAVLAAEEFGKVLMAFGALSLERDDSLGWNRFWRRFRSHNPKYANAVMMMDPFVPAEDLADFLQSTDAFVSASLSQKMAGLYVDVEDDGTVTAPIEMVREDLAQRMLAVIGAVIRMHAKVWEGRDLTPFFVDNAEQLRRLGRRNPTAMLEVLERLDGLAH
jgi:AbiV family abortive infection protein